MRCVTWFDFSNIKRSLLASTIISILILNFFGSGCLVLGEPIREEEEEAGIVESALSVITSLTSAVSKAYQQVGQKIVVASPDGVGLYGDPGAVAVSGDGNTLILGEPGDNNYVGAAWVYTKNAGVWTVEGKLVSNTVIHQGVGVSFGTGVSLSVDGNTALIGGRNDDSDIGAGWIFTRSNGVWTEQAKLVGSNSVGTSFAGSLVGLNGAGDTAVLAGWGDNERGAVWVFALSGGVWVEQGKLTDPNAALYDELGYGVAISGDGNTLLAGNYLDPGKAVVFTRSAGVWTHQATLTIVPNGTEYFGISVALNFDGNTALIGARNDGSNQGAAWIFTRSGTSWTEGSKLRGTGNTGPAYQGLSVGLSSDGKTALMGGPEDNGGIGAAWVFNLVGSTWVQQGQKLVGTQPAGSSYQGYYSSLSSDGKTVVVGGYRDNSDAGATWVFEFK